MPYDAFAEYYDLLIDNVDYEKMADYYSAILSNHGINGGILLDLGCGTGTLSALFSLKGFDVIGIDPSVGMLAKAREKTCGLSNPVLLLEQSGENLDLFGTVICCVSSLDTINHIEGKEKLQKTFDNVSLFTESGGLFVFDVNTIYKHKHILSDNCFAFETEDVFCVWQNSFNSDDNSVDINLDFFISRDDGLYDRFSDYFAEYAYDFDEIISMLKKSGFKNIEVYNSMTFEKPAEDCERAVFVCEKG